VNAPDRERSNGPITIVHLITTLSQGGAERVLSEVVPRPADHPGEQHVVVSLVPGGMFADALIAAGVEVRDLGMRPGRDALRGTLRLARLLRELEPRMVISWLSHASLLDLLARPLAGGARRAGMVWMLRGSLSALPSLPRQTRVTIRLLALASRRPDVIAANSIAGRDQHAGSGFHARRWVHIPNGCDTLRFAPDPASRAIGRERLGLAAGDFVLLFVGRNHPEKGFDLLLEALARTDTSGRSTVVLLVGAGTQLEEPLTSTSWRIVGLGERDDIPELMRAADALVLPSRSEGTPNAVLEAMASGVPCLVTDVGDSADVVGPTGVVVAPDDVDALVEGLHQLLAMDAPERERRGREGRERVVSRHSLAAARASYRGLWAAADR